MCFFGHRSVTNHTEFVIQQKLADTGECRKSVTGRENNGQKTHKQKKMYLWRIASISVWLGVIPRVERGKI